MDYEFVKESQTMNENNIINGIKKSCRIIVGVLGDISPIPGTSALLDSGIDWVFKHTLSYIDVYEYDKILSPQVAKKLKIKTDYPILHSLLLDGLNSVNALRFNDIHFESPFFEKAEYNPDKLANKTIEYLGCLQETEFADVHKSLSFIFAVYLLHWIEQDDYRYFLLSRTIDHERRILKIETDTHANGTNSFDDAATDISYWNDIIKKYETSIYLYNDLFEDNKLIREILPKTKWPTKEHFLSEYVIDSFKSKQSVHLYLNGVGGAGKTVSLIALSYVLLESGIPVIFIPLNRIEDSGTEVLPISKWIKDRVLILDDRYPEISIAVKYEKMLSSVNSSNVPFLLILDGVNEMNNPSKIVKELEVWNSLKSVSVIISSRNNEFYNLGNSTQFEYCEMLPLDDDAINDCLKNRNIIIDNEPPILKRILQLPQMIALYVGTSFAKDKFYHSKGLDWRRNNCISDVIHNYMVCQIADIVYNKQLCSAYTAVVAINYILPKLAWNIYTSDTNSISQRNIYNCVKEVVEMFSCEEYKSEVIENSLRPFDSLNIRLILFLLLDQLNLLNEFEKSHFWFTHQNYFDFFLCKYWINCVEYSVEHHKKTCWNDCILPTTVEKYFSETIGLLSSSDYDVINKYWNYHKNKSLEKDDLSLFNLIRIMKQKYNWNLSHVDFSNLDLRRICLNGVTLSENTQSATFCNSLISEYTFSPQGHHAAIIQSFFLEEHPTYLYTKDLHGNLGIYDIETDKRISFSHGRYYGGRTLVILAGSSSNALMIPNINYFLGEQIVGIDIVDTNTQEVKHIGVPRKYFVKSVIIQYIVRKKQWLVICRNNNKLCLVDEMSEYEYCIGDINPAFHYFKLIENRNQSIILLSMISKSKPYQEQIIRYEVESNSCRCIYLGDILVGYRNATLSNDGSLLTVSNEKSCVNLIDATNGLIIKNLIPLNEPIKFYNAHTLLSPDNQWCIRYCPNDDNIFPWDVYVWNIWKPSLFFTTRYSDIISSACFSLDSKKVIIGLFDGSIDTILLDDFTVHRLAVGHRVDQKMFTIDNILYVRRSDGFYQKWDVEKQQILERPCKYSFPEQRTFEPTQTGKQWFSASYNALKIWNFAINQVEQIGIFRGNNILFSNEANHLLMEIQYENILKEIRYCLHNIDEHTTSQVSEIVIPGITNEQIIIKETYLTEYGPYVVFLIQKGVVDKVFEKEGIVIWDLNKDELKLLHWFNHDTIYLDQEYALSDCGNVLMICFHHPIHYYIIHLDEGSIKNYKTDYLSSRVFTSRQIEDIKAISVHKKEKRKTPQFPRNGTLMITPDGTIVTDSKQGYRNFIKPEEDIIPEGVMSIYLGNALSSSLFAKDSLVIGCETGMVLITGFDNNEGMVLLLNESDERVTDVKVMNTASNQQLLLAAQKDDNIYIWDMSSMEYIGYLRSIPGTDIYNCNFHNAIFESETVKRLISMNGGQVDID